MEDFETYKFYIVEFIKRGRPGVREIDILPTNWIYHDRKSGKVKAAYKDPPYTNADYDLIQQLVETESDPPADWLFYNVKVVARARTYVEALKKLKVVQNQRYCFTTDSEQEPEEISAALEHQLRTKELSNSLKILTEKMKVRPMQTKQLMTSKETSPFVKPTTNNVKEHTNKKADKIIPLQINYDQEFNTITCTDELDTTITDALANEVDNSGPLDVDLPIIYIQSESGMNNSKHILSRPESTEPNESFEDGSSLQESTMCNSQITDNRKINHTSNVQTLLIENNTTMNNLQDILLPTEMSTEPRKEMLQSLKKKSKVGTRDDIIIDTLSTICTSLKQLEENQLKIINLLEVSGIIKKGIGANELRFEEKYELDLPLQTFDQFAEFDEKLAKDKNCQREFIESLYFLFDRTRNYSRTMINIIKRFLGRDLALKCTAQKKINGKHVIKDTTFSRLITDTILKSHQKSDAIITERDVFVVLGTALSNSKDWDGNRSKRSTSAQRL